MPRKAQELSPLAVGRLTEPGHHAVGGVAGLYLFVKDTGARSWVLRIMIGEKRRHVGLGGFPDVTLAMAREKARKARDAVVEGIDPIAQRRATASALRASQAPETTFKQAAEAFIKAHGDAWKNAKHEQQWTNTLTTYAYPVIGHLGMQHIGQEHVLKILDTAQITTLFMLGNLWMVRRRFVGSAA